MYRNAEIHDIIVRFFLIFIFFVFKWWRNGDPLTTYFILNKQTSNIAPDVLFRKKQRSD